jgi:3-deoxy-D-manno-octulosonate 8-phosphate phosphatase (KDO 8-P phosphatase)
VAYKNFILDVDGCLNDGCIYWGVDGKPFKAFGNYDHDGLKLLRKHINIQFISADKAGWNITNSRIVDHMKFPLTLVPEATRFDFVKNFNLDETIYMGDGFYDAPIIKAAALGIAPAQARIEAKEAADFVTYSKGGHGAVMDACLYIMDKMGISYAI